ncbi:zinc finger CCCH domain-containing protein 11A-like isoform X2 [Eleutherodactylus coqui]|uniref:zinc finger CCCH domain-containing protein 11A-like isoform X2 n=1 Tax=Eleutherodactylus coqui TaxID=57060 RepID=UPI003462EE0E
MSNQGDDCYFFFYSTCTKGDGCAFRHCEAALGNEMVCTLWQEGRCFRQICKFRHMEIDKKRSEIPCYWENQMSGCQKANCAFHHIKGRFVEGAYFPPSKALVKPEPCEPDVPTPLSTQPAPTKLPVAPTPQLRGVKKMEATENVPSPTHPPVVINAADDDEDDDDQFSEEGEEMRNSAPHNITPGHQYGAHSASTGKSVAHKKDADLNYGIKTLEEIKSEKQKDREMVKDDYTASPEIFVSPSNQIESISVLRTIKFRSKDSTTNLSLAQRLGKRKKFPGDSPLVSSGGDVLSAAKKTLSERLGRKNTPSTDSPEIHPKKVQISRPLKDRLGLPSEQSSIDAEIPVNKRNDFRIKTLQEIREEKANQRLEQEATGVYSQSKDKISIKSKFSSKPQTEIYIKSLSEIQAEKKLRQLKDGIQKQENTKDEKNTNADKEQEQNRDGNMAQNYTIPTETTRKQTDFNWKIEGEEKIKRPIINDHISSNFGTSKPPSTGFKGPKLNLLSIEKVRVKTLEEIRQEKALRLQQTAKSEKGKSVSQQQASLNHKKLMWFSKLPMSADAVLDKSGAESSLPINKSAEEENKTSETFRSPGKTSEKEQSKKTAETKTENSAPIADSEMSPLKDGSDAEVLKPTRLTLAKRVLQMCSRLQINQN